MTNTRLLDALQCKNKGRPPIWLMRQAGRYMPSYQALRKKHSFLELCHQTELVVETTLLPVEELGVDAAIVFSDLLVIAQAFGFDLRFDEGVGPLLHPYLREPQAISMISTQAIEETLAPLFKAISLLRNTLKVPLVGFAGAPFTLASYLIEGKTSRDLRYTKKWMYSDPESFHLLLDKLTEAICFYLKLQIEAGAQAIQVFDSWALHLPLEQFREFSLTYFKKIQASLPKEIPLIFFCRGAQAILLPEAKPAAVSVDWTIDIARLRQRHPTGIALQGNLDPSWLYSPVTQVKQAADQLLTSMKNDPGYIFNLGHGILPDIPYSTVQALVEHVRSYH